MTLPRKISRTITVDGTPFRWTARPGSGYDDVPFTTQFMAHEDVFRHGALLHAELDPNIADVVTPPIAETLIRLARKLGWDISKSGKFNLSKDELQKHIHAFGS